MSRYIKVDPCGETKTCEESEVVDYMPSQFVHADGELERTNEEIENLKSFVQAMFEVLPCQQRDKIADKFGFELMKEGEE